MGQAINGAPVMARRTPGGKAPSRPDIWSQTASGAAWNVLKPEPTDVSWTDIASALSKLCRFNGHTNRFYSVAEHSVRVLQAVRQETQGQISDPAVARWLWLRALLHDAHEAYLGDRTTPVGLAVRHILNVNGVTGDPFAMMKTVHDAAIFSAAGVLEIKDMSLSVASLRDMMRIIKRADVAVMMAERASLMGTPPKSWGDQYEDVKPADVTIAGLPPKDAMWGFLAALRNIAPDLLTTTD